MTSWILPPIEFNGESMIWNHVAFDYWGYNVKKRCKSAYLTYKLRFNIEKTSKNDPVSTRIRRILQDGNGGTSCSFFSFFFFPLFWEQCNSCFSFLWHSSCSLRMQLMQKYWQLEKPSSSLKVLFWACL